MIFFRIPYLFTTDKKMTQYSRYILSILIIYILITRFLLIKALKYSITNTIDSGQENPIELSDESFDFTTERFIPTIAKTGIYFINETYEYPGTYHDEEIFMVQDKVYGAVYLYKSVYWMAFRGTINLTDFLQDTKTTQTEPSWTTIGNQENQQVHNGFYNIYIQIRNQIFEWLQNRENKDIPIVICGHSLGASLIILLLSDKEIQDNLYQEKTVCYTFGCPKVGNPQFVKNLELFNFINCFRVENTEDIVPTKPLPISFHLLSPTQPVFYQHYGNPVVFTEQKYSYYKNHSIYTYNIKR
jgi:hypothetical protein